MPLAQPLIMNLEKSGYIVIASVATPQAGDALERMCSGYVRALVLDPEEVRPAFAPVFPSILQRVLSSPQQSQSFSALSPPSSLANSLSTQLEIRTFHLPHTLTSILSFPFSRSLLIPRYLRHSSISRCVQRILITYNHPTSFHSK